MAIRHGQPPSAGAALLKRHRSRLLRSTGAGGGAGPKRGVAGGHALSKPHAVYTFSVASIVASEGRSAASLALLDNWRYFLQRPDGSVGAVILGVADDGTLHFAGVREGPVAGRLIDAITRAEKLALIRDGDWELRGFQVPEMMVMGIWFHAPRVDFLMPVYVTKEAGVQAFLPYKAGEFFKHLRPHANELNQRPPLDEI